MANAIKKQAEAKKLRSRIILAARGKGMNKEQLYQVMPAWGFKLTLSKYQTPVLTQILAYLNGFSSFDSNYPGIVTNPVKGMATVKQQKYVITLYKHYASLRGIKPNEHYKYYHEWLKKYCKTDHIGFCRVKQASKAIFMLEREIITTFGADALERLKDGGFNGRNSKAERSKLLAKS